MKQTRYIAQCLRENEKTTTELRFSAAAAIDSLLDVIESSGRKAPDARIPVEAPHRFADLIKHHAMEMAKNMHPSTMDVYNFHLRATKMLTEAK